MNRKWEENGVSTSEQQVFDKINRELAQPVGIIIFGADCELKDDVLRECSEQVPNLFIDKCVWGFPCFEPDFDKPERKAQYYGKNMLFRLSGGMSIDREYRRWACNALRNAGVKSVVGIYAKMVDLKRDSYYMMSETRAKREEVRQCVAELKVNPPTADGLDYLFTVSEDEEG